jgi:flagellar biosynthesis/type III secretory pathway M-ring protein FliF/YscJ
MQYAIAFFARLRALPKPLQIGGVVALVTLVAVSIAGGIVAHPASTALFAVPLHPEQLTEVEERLAGWNVAFTPTADNVIVTASRRNDILLRLSLAGIPHEHLETTAEALANVGVLTPQAVIDAQTRAGLAGDIESGLRGIDGIDDVRAIVAPAKLPEFADDSSREASASIRVRMRAGETLSREAVAASVAGLDASHVTILDDRGVALGAGSGQSESNDLERSLQSALDAAYGEGATIVRVHAEYRSTDTSERDVRRTAAGPQPIARTARSESYHDEGKQYRRDEENDDRGSETHEIVTQFARGELERISTAVFVDESRALDIPKVRDLAAAAVGYDPRRGDLLAVQAVDFHHALPVRKDPWWLLYGAIVPAIPTCIVVIGLLIGAKLALPQLSALLKPVFERAEVERTSKLIAGYAPSRVRSVLAQEPPHAAAAIISALPAATAAAVLDLYPPHEREAIVRRMQRPHSPLLADAQELLRRHA